MKKATRYTVMMICVILSAIMFSSCSKQDPNAPDGFKTASNETVDYYLYVPSDWLIDTVEGSQLTSARVSEYGSTNISMTAFTDSDLEFESVEDYWEYYKSALVGVFDLAANELGDKVTTFELLNGPTETDAADGDTAIMGGAAARKYVYTATLGGVELKYMQVIAMREHTFYIFTYTAYPSSYDEDTVLQIVDYIKFK